MSKLRPYQSPDIVSYTREDISELMGPVTTQYVADCSSCNVELSQDQFLQVKPDQELAVTVDTLGCQEFTQVRLDVPGEPVTTYARTDGDLTGNEWTINLTGLQFSLQPGSYPVEVTLIDGFGNESTVCTAFLDVIL